VDFFVGCGSTAFGRIVYALRAVSFPEKVSLRSLLVGSDWGLKNMCPKPSLVAIVANTAENQQELSLKAGDRIEQASLEAIWPNRSTRPFPDEFIYGKKVKGELGLFPRFKARKNFN